jgi:hypothetical protein
VCCARTAAAWPPSTTSGTNASASRSNATKHAGAIRPFAAKHEEELGPPDDDTVGETTTAALRHKVSELIGRRPESGLLLLRSLLQLYLQAQEVSFHGIVAGQLAQATRDPELLAVVDELHRETLTQIKWLKTQVKHSSPQALVVGAGSWPSPTRW